MLYHVKARPIPSTLKTFSTALKDGTIANQVPDGQEIVASMKRAVVSKDYVEWNENCFCSPPLHHERSTVYDQYFNDMQIETAKSNIRLQGESFWEKLAYTTSQEESSSKVLQSKNLQYLPTTTRLI